MDDATRTPKPCGPGWMTDPDPVKFASDWDWIPESTKRDFEDRAKSLLAFSDTPGAWKVVLAQMLIAAQQIRALATQGTIDPQSPASPNIS